MIHIPTTARPAMISALTMAFATAGVTLLLASCVVPPAPPPGSTTTSTRPGATTTTTRPPPRGGPIGMNLDTMAAWGTAMPFVDAFKMTAPWVSNRAGRPWGQGGPLRLTPEGWVASLDAGQTADTVMLMTGGHSPVGRYTLLYDGEGTLELSGTPIVSQRPGRWEVDVTSATQQIDLSETATNPANPIRNIRFLMPGHEADYRTNPWNPTFIDRLRPFNALRMGDWTMGETYITPVGLVNWADRPKPTDATQGTSKGVAVEYITALANLLGDDLWVNIPHISNDDYITQYATYLRQNLNPNLKIYVEWSNEVWNDTFAQNAYADRLGIALGLGGTDPRQAALRYYAQRSVETFAIFDRVFGASARGRLIRTLSAQTDEPWTADQVLSWNGAASRADAFAVGPYFHCVPELLDNAAGAQRIIDMPMTELLDRCERDITGRVLDIDILANKAAADRYRLPMISYEGGQHLIGIGSQATNQALAAKLIAANRHPRMGDLYRLYITQWQQRIGTQFMALGYTYFPTVSGSWGALEWQDQDLATAHKYRALRDLAVRPTR